MNSMDGAVNEQLLARLADKLNPKHLERFTTEVIGFGHAKYSHIIHDACGDSWKECHGVSCTHFELNQNGIENKIFLPY